MATAQYLSRAIASLVCQLSRYQHVLDACRILWTELQCAGVQQLCEWSVHCPICVHMQRFHKVEWTRQALMSLRDLCADR